VAAEAINIVTEGVDVIRALQHACYDNHYARPFLGGPGKLITDPDCGCVTCPPMWPEPSW
jgi:hypothetical protein